MSERKVFEEAMIDLHRQNSTIVIPPTPALPVMSYVESPNYSVLSPGLRTQRAKSSYEVFLKDIKRINGGYQNALINLPFVKESKEKAIREIKDMTIKGEYQGPLEITNRITAEIVGLPKEANEREEIIIGMMENNPIKFQEYQELHALVEEGVYEAISDPIMLGGPTPQVTREDIDNEIERSGKLKPEGLIERYTNSISEHPALTAVIIGTFTVGGALFLQYGLPAISNLINGFSSHEPSKPDNPNPPIVEPDVPGNSTKPDIEPIKNPVVEYANSKGLSPEIKEKLRPLGIDGIMSENERALVDSVAYVGSGLIPANLRVYYKNQEVQDIQSNLIDSVLSDGNVSSVETEAMQKLPSERWYVARDVIDSGMVSENALKENWDKSGPTNIAEIRQGTNPLNDLEDDSSNLSERHAILVNNGGIPSSAGRILGLYHILKKNGYSDDKINLSFSLEKPRYNENQLSVEKDVGLLDGIEWLKDNFKGNLLKDYNVEVDHRDGEITPIAFLNWIRELKTDDNDTIFIYYGGHGPGPLGPVESVLAKDMNVALNSKSYGRGVFINESCGAESYLKQLIEPNQLRNTAAIGTSSVGENVGAVFTDNFMPLVMKGVNIEEAYETAKQLTNTKDHNPVIYSFDSSVIEPKNSKLPWLNSFNIVKYLKI
ncbi:MAG: hypothetical protein ABIE55_02090 [Candidatus Aenigmatarchaeota archaeon]